MPVPRLKVKKIVNDPLDKFKPGMILHQGTLALPRPVLFPVLLMPMFDVKIGVRGMGIDPDELTEVGEAIIKQKLPVMAIELKQALDMALRSPVWSWSGGTRDVIDTGELLQAGTVTVQGMSLSIQYPGVPYANLVHNGGYIQPYGNPDARPVYMPPRPWISSTLNGGGPVPQWRPKFD